jgi:hypothetical protein
MGRVTTMAGAAGLPYAVSMFVYTGYWVTGCVLTLGFFDSADPVYNALLRAVINELRGLFWCAAVYGSLHDAIVYGRWQAELDIVLCAGVWLLLRGHHDDRWTRRGRRLLERVKRSTARLVVVPVREAGTA